MPIINPIFQKGAKLGLTADKRDYPKTCREIGKSV